MIKGMGGGGDGGCACRVAPYSHMSLTKIADHLCAAVFSMSMLKRNVPTPMKPARGSAASHGAVAEAGMVVVKRAGGGGSQRKCWISISTVSGQQKRTEIHYCERVRQSDHGSNGR